MMIQHSTRNPDNNHGCPKMQRQVCQRFTAWVCFVSCETLHRSIYALNAYNYLFCFGSRPIQITAGNNDNCVRCNARLLGITSVKQAAVGRAKRSL
jgi:hypothetical protein